MRGWRGMELEYHKIIVDDPVLSVALARRQKYFHLVECAE